VRWMIWRAISTRPWQKARAAAAAAAGASGGALREARDEVSKLRLRENHWVGLIGCHREAASLSRELAELAATHGGEGAQVALDAAAGTDLIKRRTTMESEARPELSTIDFTVALTSRYH